MSRAQVANSQYGRTRSPGQCPSAGALGVPGASPSNTQPVFQQGWQEHRARVHPDRKQASFTTGRAYDFSGQNNHCISDEAQWPSLVTGVLQHAQRTRLPHEPCPNIVHANWYASGKDALGAHADDEVGIDKTYGITGYTFYTQPALALQRSVQFYVPGEAGHTTVHSVPLPDASCYKMEGDFQQVYKHGMRPQGTRLFQGTQRISLIVRCMLDLGAPSSATVL